MGLACNRRLSGFQKPAANEIDDLRSGFLNPPDSAKPGVYWYFMDGNLSKSGMTADLESMKEAGIANVVFLEVNVGVPRGPVDFLSEKWLELFKHAVDECKRLHISMTLGIGPGWTGSGGPWVTPEESMKHLVSSSVEIRASDRRNKPVFLPVPSPKKPYFGESTFTPELKEEWKNYYKDVAVLAFPTPSSDKKIIDTDHKALYYRAPYSSVKDVQPFIPSFFKNENADTEKFLSAKQIINLTGKLNADGTLDWKVPKGNWTIMRFVARNNGAVTRPAPEPGLGFESDKFDTVALNDHLEAYVGKILKYIDHDPSATGGLKFLHMDSWEMGAQNWTENFREEFIKRRGYDLLPFYPVYAGIIVGNEEISERFLWDLRQTSQELVFDYHARQVKKYSHENGLKLSIEPYDMNPTSDLELGAIADIPMCEFWSKGYGFNTSFSTVEATSIAHIEGIPVVQAEAFTANPGEDWKQYPGSMKNQGDWAFAAGINKFFYHTFAHKPLDEKLFPGMTMGPYGVHWDRKQTWWPLANAYHQYVARCQYLLQQGRTVADILYLAPEGAPQVFLPPATAMSGNDTLPDRREYNFDGCSPSQLDKAIVKNNQILFPGGASYQLLVLPAFKTMTPKLLKKIESLIRDGATVVGIPPQHAPGLSNYPDCDQEVRSIAQEIWGTMQPPVSKVERIYGKGKVIWGGKLTFFEENNIYPDYEETSNLLREMDVAPDFVSEGLLRYTHRTSKDFDIYFVSNRTNNSIKTEGTFRAEGIAELWDPLTGKTRPLPEFAHNTKTISVPLQFYPYQSYFIVFNRNGFNISRQAKNFPDHQILQTITGAWNVSFDPKWGGPEHITFDSLTDWRFNANEGIRYYSGIAVYNKKFNLNKRNSGKKERKFYLDLGKVKNMAKVSLNGHDLGVVWTAPWRIDITHIVRQKDNELKISVANLWPNRMIGDQQLPDDGIAGKKWFEWLISGKPRTSGRYTFSTYNPFKKDSPLLESGLLGPVTIVQEEF